MDISFRLYYLRMKHGCTKTAIAKAVGVSRRTVYAWERGLKYPTADHIVKLAKFFHVSTDYMMNLENACTEQ